MTPRFLLATALIVHFGIESLRALMPLLVFGLRDRFGWAALGPIGSIRLLGFALLLFALTFAAGPLGRRLGRRSTIRGCVLGLVVFRLLAQLWSGDPLIHLLSIMLALLCFLVIWPVWWSPSKTLGAGAAHGGAPHPFSHQGSVGLGILLGTTLSASLHGVLRTYDAIWRRDVPHLALATVLAGLLVAIIWRRDTPPTAPGAKTKAADRVGSQAAAGNAAAVTTPSWFAFGPFLFLQLLVFLNLARLTVLTGWSQSHGAVFLVLCHGLAVVLAWRLAAAPVSRVVRQSLWTLLSALLVISLAFPWPTGWLAALSLLLGQGAAAGLLILVSTGATPTGDTGGTTWRPRGVASHGVGMLSLLAFLFLYYAGYDLPLPFDQQWLLPVAALLLAWGAWRRSSPSPVPMMAGGGYPSPVPGVLFIGLAVLIALPWTRALIPSAAASLGTSSVRSVAAASQGLTSQDLTSQDRVFQDPGASLRIMTYNLHCGFGAQGYLRLEEQAAVIIAQQPDVVALQEISRGWVINGGVDMLAWLALRLDMDYHFAPTADPLWGNATLSRRPIVAAGSLDYATSARQQIRRGLLEVSIPAASRGQTWTIINTHFHHRRSDGAVRVGQAQAMLEAWGRRPRSVLVGDFNAQPDSREMGLMRAAGLIDSVGRRLASPGEDGDIGDGLTFRADALERRIDYIWLSPDLASRDLAVVASTASDHLAIATTVSETIAEPPSTITPQTSPGAAPPPGR